MSLREDEMVVREIIRAPVVVAKMTGEQDTHKVRGGKRRARMARSGGARAADAVDAKLPGEIAVGLELRRSLRPRGAHPMRVALPLGAAVLVSAGLRR